MPGWLMEIKTAPSDLLGAGRAHMLCPGFRPVPHSEQILDLAAWPGPWDPGPTPRLLVSDPSSPLPFQENPYVMRRPNFQALSGNERFEGFCVDMLRELAQLLRFRYRLRLVEDGLYGAPEPNGSWTGMVGELINRVWPGQTRAGKGVMACVGKGACVVGSRGASEPAWWNIRTRSESLRAPRANHTNGALGTCARQVPWSGRGGKRDSVSPPVPQVLAKCFPLCHHGSIGTQSFVE